MVLPPARPQPGSVISSSLGDHQTESRRLIMTQHSFGHLPRRRAVSACSIIALFHV